MSQNTATLALRDRAIQSLTGYMVVSFPRKSTFLYSMSTNTNFERTFSSNRYKKVVSFEYIGSGRYILFSTTQNTGVVLPRGSENGGEYVDFIAMSFDLEFSII